MLPPQPSPHPLSPHGFPSCPRIPGSVSGLTLGTVPEIWLTGISLHSRPWLPPPGSPPWLPAPTEQFHAAWPQGLCHVCEKERTYGSLVKAEETRREHVGSWWGRQGEPSTDSWETDQSLVSLCTVSSPQPHYLLLHLSLQLKVQSMLKEMFVKWMNWWEKLGRQRVWKSWISVFCSVKWACKCATRDFKGMVRVWPGRVSSSPQVSWGIACPRKPSLTSHSMDTASTGPGGLGVEMRWRLCRNLVVRRDGYWCVSLKLDNNGRSVKCFLFLYKYS